MHISTEKIEITDFKVVPPILILLVKIAYLEDQEKLQSVVAIIIQWEREQTLTKYPMGVLIYINRAFRGTSKEGIFGIKPIFHHPVTNYNKI